MSEAAAVYAEALYGLAKDTGAGEEVAAQLEALGQAFAQEPDFLRLLASPEVPKLERCRVLDDSFRGKVHPYVLNFLKLLTEKGRVRSFPDCVTAYRARYDSDHGILPVTAVTAVPLSDAQAQRLTQTLAARTGKTIRLKCVVDPSQLGGVRLDYDGKRVEDTVARRLETLGAKLKNTVL